MYELDTTNYTLNIKIGRKRTGYSRLLVNLIKQVW